MEKKKNLSLINCIATTLLAFFFTVPLHEFFHVLTEWAYGGKITYYSAGAVDAARTVDMSALSPFHRIMVAGGSASIVNAVIAVVLAIILVKARLRPMSRLFMTQYMGAQMVQGIGYFMIGGFFGAGDWGNVFDAFPNDPGAVAAMRIILSVLGAGGIVFLMFFLNYLSYYFIEDQNDKKQRLEVGLKLHLTMFVIPAVIGVLSMIESPAIKEGYLTMGIALLFDLMWIPFFWAFLYTAFMVKPPKKSRYLYDLPGRPQWILLVIGIVLVLVDIIIFGPGIYFK